MLIQYFMSRKPFDPQETKEDKFKRVAEPRVNDILDRLRVLGNCSNKHAYRYNSEQVDKIFTAIEAEVQRTRALFTGRTSPTVKL